MNLREIEIFKPYSNEFPAHLLEGVGLSDGQIDQWQQAQILRIAKKGEDILAAYAMNRTSSQMFHLEGVVVDQPVRKQGLGRWVIGHAIGVAESKGGRQLTLAQTGGSRCFAKIGFEPHNDGHWQFSMIQE